MSHELIVFHEWFKAKAFGLEYPAKIQKPKVVVTPVEVASPLSLVANN